jgi:hypothetical protein
MHIVVIFFAAFIGGLALFIWPGPWLYSFDVNRYPPEKDPEPPLPWQDWVFSLIFWIVWCIIGAYLKFH